jgi:uncharacterized membrane protein YqjE
MSTPRDEDVRDRSTGELLRRLSDETTTLVKQEVELAKAELQQKGKQAGVGAGMFGGAGLFGVASFAALTACIIAALDLGMPLWLAALIVALIWLAVAGALALTGKSKVQQATPPVPEQTQQSVKEDVEWAKTHARSARR